MWHKSKYLTVHLFVTEDGVHAEVQDLEDSGTIEKPIDGQYSSSSVCLDEVSSVLDGILFSFLARTHIELTERLGGLR